MPRPTARTAAGLAATLAAGLALAAAVPAGAALDPPSSPDDIAAVVADMSVDELIGQMTWTHVYGSTADDTSMASENRQRYGVDTPAEVIAKYDLGGVLYFTWSNPVVQDDPVATAELSNSLQAASVATGSGIPLATTIDQEGGLVARMGPPVTVLPGGMALGATFDSHLAEAQGHVLGAEMAAVGINVDFAPVVDLNTNPANPVIGIRSMGQDVAQVGAMGMAQIEAMQEEGVAAAAKHFPGHGDTDVDSHTGLPIVTYDRATLDAHLAPFEAAIDAGVDIIMSAHIIVEALDDEMPGTLSPDVLTGLLREEMGYDGLITTDALDMAALKQLPGNPLDDAEIAALAIAAGSDILLNSPDVDAFFTGVHDAIAAGDLSRERLEASVTRILEWKVDRGIWTQDPSVPVDAAAAVVGDIEHLAIADEIGERATTLLRNDGDVLPLDVEGDSVLVAGAPSAEPGRLGRLLEDRGFAVTGLYEEGDSLSQSYRARAVEAAGDHDVVVFASNNASGAQQEMVAALAAAGTPVVVVATRNPDDVNVLPDAAAVLAVYGWWAPNLHGAVAALAGDVDPPGRLPVDVLSADGQEVLLPVGFGLRYEAEPEPSPTDDASDTATPETEPAPATAPPGPIPGSGAAVGWLVGAVALLLAAGVAAVLIRRRGR